MRESIVAYARGIWKHGRALLTGALAGAIGIGLTVHPLVVSAWIWFVMAGLAVLRVQFLAFHDLRLQYASLRTQLDERPAPTLHSRLLPLYHRLRELQAIQDEAALGVLDDDVLALLQERPEAIADCQQQVRRSDDPTVNGDLPPSRA